MDMFYTELYIFLYEKCFPGNTNSIIDFKLWRELDTSRCKMPGILRTDHGQNPSMKQHNVRNVIAYPVIRDFHVNASTYLPVELFNGHPPEGSRILTIFSVMISTCINVPD